ncbi:hypothetical protein LTR86_002462 [Recurvomyces mirabilis]|nr:hypothetical protein LTR86_002462 [Recurvomyces mirabilis]
MASPLRPRNITQCSACIRSYLTAGFGDLANPPTTALRQQVRGKKKLANTSSTVPVRLLKDMRTFGRRGSIVPISPGQMRNEWLPRRVAEYVTVTEQKSLRLRNVAFERDFDFGLAANIPPPAATSSSVGGMTRSEQQEASMFQRAPVETARLSAERCRELIELFVPSRLDFFRQPILEEKEAEPEPALAPELKKSSRSVGLGAGAELMAARAQSQAEAKLPKPKIASGPQAIYGSVSTHDILVAVREQMARNDEAKMVAFREEDIRFVELPAESEADRVKFVGDYAVEVRCKGVEEAKRVVVRVIGQEVA